MSYRDDDDGWIAKRDALERDIRTAGDLDTRERLAGELAEIDLQRRVLARKRLPVIATARIASPCHEVFETMHGDGAIRTCARCDHEVFDVARMTLGQAEALIASRTTSACVRLHRRSDGTMMFADCEVGARGVSARRGGLVIAAAVIATTVLGLGSRIPPALRHVAPVTHDAPDPAAAPYVQQVMGLMRAAPTETRPGVRFLTDTARSPEERASEMVPFSYLDGPRRGVGS